LYILAPPCFCVFRLVQALNLNPAASFLFFYRKLGAPVRKMTIQKLGHISFSMAVGGLAIVHLLMDNFQSTKVFDTSTTTVYVLTGFLFWTGLIVFSLGISFSNKPDVPAIWMAWLIFLWIVVRHIPLLISDSANPAQWNFTCMALATCGGAFIVAGSFFKNINFGYQKISKEETSRFKRYMLAGKILLGLSLLVLGFQHVLYADFIASMIPSWIPVRVAWAWVTGIALMMAGVSFLVNLKIAWSSFALGAMLSSWILILHVPRIISQPQNFYEWIYAFQALTIITSAFVLYGIQRKSVQVATRERTISLEVEQISTDLEKRQTPELDIPIPIGFEKHPVSRGGKVHSRARTSSDKYS